MHTDVLNTIVLREHGNDRSLAQFVLVLAGISENTFPWTLRSFENGIAAYSMVILCSAFYL